MSCGHCSYCCANEKDASLKGGLVENEINLKVEGTGSVRHLKVDSEEEIEVQVVNPDHWTTREIDVDHYVLLSGYRKYIFMYQETCFSSFTISLYVIFFRH